MKAHVFMHAASAYSALGTDAQSLRDQIFSVTDPQALTWTDCYSSGRQLPLGCLPSSVVLPALDFAPAWQRSRNNALAWAAVRDLRADIDQAVAKWGPARVALIVGTSTAGVQEGEAAASGLQQHGQFPQGFNYAVQEMGNVAVFLAQHLGIQGPAHTISTACSSGAKALASAARLLRSGMVDAVVAGGVDALCRFTVAGFSALEAVSAQRCNPLSANRNGINLGEAAAFFVLSRDRGPVRLAGWGESQDAHHMSAPDPSGQGAVAAMQQALQRADMVAAQVDYVNLHGTATQHNDAMESKAVAAVFGAEVAVSSTKPLTGHALAAAGALEAAIAWQVLQSNPEGKLPVHWWDGAADAQLPALAVVQPGTQLGRPVRAVMSNSFAFGGSNSALLFEAT
ncbi:beta-ketoacyl-[acyl-carrier-protein] synthase II [Acidovorax sp. SRB_14]|uniref:beta-ketoacyl-ACP synthase n=1 Tax=Acidovorax sp. SRB_14 TaxID=1962699 RepID=UPI0015672052|nr:beta-ketoacyl-ACP synthase [Acidovorax sp. SRB_14]NMM80848.1 beta-ketoacyl-[acyl-carrier-protein] synthase II [Acidovorax sp. SRB_14]